MRISSESEIETTLFAVYKHIERIGIKAVRILSSVIVVKPEDDLTAMYLTFLTS